MVKHCCEDMAAFVYCVDDVNHTIEKSVDIENKIIYYSSKFREYGIPIKSGKKKISSSYIIIQHCPWCGSCLPYSKRDEWFDTLEAMGYDSPLEQNIPIDFKSSAWYELKE